MARKKQPTKVAKPIRLSDEELQFLHMVRSRQGTGDPVMPKEPIGPRLQALIDRGYMRLTVLLDGVFRQPTGERGLALTEAGNTVLTSEKVRLVDLVAPSSA